MESSGHLSEQGIKLGNKIIEKIPDVRTADGGLANA